jgi:hypothetical protein
MIYKWINTDNGQKSGTHTNNPDYIARLDSFIADSDIKQDEQGRYIINDEIRETILTADDDNQGEYLA